MSNPIDEKFDSLDQKLSEEAAGAYAATVGEGTAVPRRRARAYKQTDAEPVYSDPETLPEYMSHDEAYRDKRVNEEQELEDELRYDEEEQENENEWADTIRKAWEKGKKGLISFGKKAKESSKKIAQSAGKPKKAAEDEVYDPEDYDVEREEPVEMIPKKKTVPPITMPKEEAVQPAPEPEAEPVPAVTPVSRRARREGAEAAVIAGASGVVSRRAIREAQEAARRAEEERLAAEKAENASEEPAQPEKPEAAEEPAAPVIVEEPAETVEVPAEPEIPEEPAQPVTDTEDAFDIENGADAMLTDDEKTEETPSAPAEENFYGIPGQIGFGAPVTAEETPAEEAQPAPETEVPAEEQPAAAEEPKNETPRPVFAFDDEAPAPVVPAAVLPQIEEKQHDDAAEIPPEENIPGLKKIKHSRFTDDDDDLAPTPARLEQPARMAKKEKTAAPKPEKKHKTFDEYDDDDDLAEGVPVSRKNGKKGRKVEEANKDPNAEAPVPAFSAKPYDDEGYEPDMEDYKEDKAEKKPKKSEDNSMLKGLAIFLVLILLILGTVFALDRLHVINVRDLAKSITSFSFVKNDTSSEPEATEAPAAPTAETAASTAAPEAEATEAVGTTASAASGEFGVLATNTPAAGPAMIGGMTLLSAEVGGYPDPTPVPTESPVLLLKADPVDEAKPDRSYFGLKYEIYKNYHKKSDYKRSEVISFGQGSEYTDLKGVITFRGNNFRENAAYGRASLSEKKMEVMWHNKISSIDSGYAVWSGVGWNGQCVMVQWSDEMRHMMNIREKYQDDDDLVEVIYGTLDGNIYFLDAKTGNYTRDPIELGFPIKGSVSIDPRGYPLLYVGQGISKANGKTGSIGWRVYSLLDQKQLYLLSGHDDLRYRTHGSFDGVSLIDAETDTAVTGAENGIFYTIKLNTKFNLDKPSISIDPEITLMRYKSKISEAELGIENSIAAYGQYAYFVDNSGLMFCMDLNSMKPQWLFDVGDDTDASINLEVESSGRVVLYTVNEVDKQGSKGTVTIRKLDALTGQELWNYSMTCKSDGTNGGGGFASPANGKKNLKKYIYFNVCRVSGKDGGVLYCFNKETGEIVWSKETGRYSWSSPVLVYDKNGDGVLIVGNSGGMLRMYDPKTGSVLDELEIKGNMEGSPAVFNDMLVIGTRSEQIYGIKIK